MRCTICNVDLNETAPRCPLCGGRAQNVPPRIEGIAYQTYPAYAHKGTTRAAPSFADFSAALRGLLRS